MENRKISLLIGFKYKREFKELPGIVIDLYHAYLYSKKIRSEIHIITDIITDESVLFLKNVVFGGLVHSDIISFISNIKNTEEYHPYVSEEQFEEDISNIIRDCDQLFFYYTGHGEKNELLLPKNEKIELKRFRDIILINTARNSQIFSIMDCCNGSNFGIPFKLKNNDYRLISRKLRYFTEQDIIQIVSSQDEENSVTSGEGSIFTTKMFQFLNSQERDIRKIVNEVSKECLSLYPQTATLYVSRPNIYTTWNWMSFKHHDFKNLQISFNPFMGMLIIKNYDKLDNMKICYRKGSKSNLKF